MPFFARLPNRLQPIPPLNTQPCGAANLWQERAREPFWQSAFSQGLVRQFASPGNPSPPLSSNPSFTPQPIPGHYYTMPPADDKVTFLACSTPQSCHPAIRQIKIQEPKELGMLRMNTSTAGLLEQRTPPCQRFPWLSGKCDIFEQVYPCPFILLLSITPVLIFCRCLPKSPETLIPFLHTSISCEQAVHTDTPTQPHFPLK